MAGPQDEEPGDGCTLGLDRASFEALVDAANGGDRQALAELRRVLDDNPSIWQALGDLQARAGRAWIDLASGGDVAVAEALRRQVAALRAELGGTAPGAVERLLVDQVVAVHLELKYLEASVAGTPGGSPGQVAPRLQRLESAQRRYTAALRSLVTIRRLIPRGDVAATLRVVPGASRRA